MGHAKALWGLKKRKNKKLKTEPDVFLEEESGRVLWLKSTERLWGLKDKKKIL